MNLFKSKVDRTEDLSINMMSLADKVKGQGVGTAYLEQVKLVRETIGNRYDITINKIKHSTITHYHSINFRFFLHARLVKKKTVRVGYVHFIPETVEGSIILPKWMKRIFYWYIIEFYKTMDVLVTVNPMFVEKLVTLGFDRRHVKYIPNFVSESLFYRVSDAEKMALKTHYDVEPNKFVVLGVGQVQTRKGIVDFVDVAKKCPECDFIWAGGFSFGKITDGYEVLNEIVSHPPKNVKFLGIIDREEMNSLYNLADVMFLPSYSELFPMTVLESMNVGLPLVLRDLELYEDILFDYYLKANDNHGFETLIQRLSTNPEFYRLWSEQSRTGHKFYSKESVGQMWEKFYDDMANYESSEDYDNHSQAAN